MTTVTTRSTTTSTTTTTIPATPDETRVATGEPRPRWVVPALLVVTAASAFLNAWRAGAYLETYYAAAVRSMAGSWHAFAYGAFDPKGTITLDKLPGAFWIQALMVRAFGLHTWAMVAPQVVEGTLSVLVLYAIVARLCGRRAGLFAAAVLALSPAAVALNRGNVSDTLMLLLVLVAAYAAVRSTASGSWSWVALSGAAVGGAFLAKMMEAWFVLPVLAVVVLLAAPGRLVRRFAQVVVLGIVAGVVSLAWPVLVGLTPASSRPYVDGSTNNSVLQQVFVYNGFGRVDQAAPNQVLSRTTGIPIPNPPAPSWHRLLTGGLGRDAAWLVPAALVALVALLVVTWREPRTDPLRLNAVLWGAWLAVFGLALSLGSSLNAYYTAALCPPLAGLLAGGAVVAWRHRDQLLTRVVVAITVVTTGLYAVWLLPDAGTGLPGWLAPVVVVASVAAALLVLLAPRARTARRWAYAAAGAALVALLVAPATASVQVASNRLGPFDTPFQPIGSTYGVRAFFHVDRDVAALLPTLQHVRYGAPDLMAVQSSAVAAPFIYETGLETLPLGGFTGTEPSPSLATLQQMVQRGDFHLALVSPGSKDPRFLWVARHCSPAPQPQGQHAVVRLAIYFCSPTKG